jgi:hypothetical protein
MARPTAGDGAGPSMSSVDSWLREHALQLLTLASSALAAACFFVGRSELLGWYHAAGVSHLAFTWSVQDVIIRGVLRSQTWLSAFAFAFFTAIGVALLEWCVDLKDRLQKRGESCDRLALRKRFVDRARAARLEQLPNASLETARWKVLGTRARVQKTPGASGAAERAPLSLGTRAVLVAIGLFYVFCLYLAAVLTLFIPAYQDGADKFRALHVAATGRFPPARQPKVLSSGSSDAGKNEPIETWATRGRAELAGVAYVRVESEALADNTPLCGWLLNEQENRVLVLTRSGLVMKNFGDQSHAWTSRDPEQCHDNDDQVNTRRAR